MYVLCSHEREKQKKKGDHDGEQEGKNIIIEHF